MGSFGAGRNSASDSLPETASAAPWLVAEAEALSENGEFEAKSVYPLQSQEIL